jgi:hypothetical protein
MPNYRIEGRDSITGEPCTRILTAKFRTEAVDFAIDDGMDVFSASLIPEVPEDAPALTRYRITGVDRATGYETQWFVQAASEGEARTKAEAEGITIVDIVPQDD